MRFTEYVKLRDEERNVTMSIILGELETLEEDYLKLLAAYNKLLKEHSTGNGKVKVGFKPTGRK